VTPRAVRSAQKPTVNATASTNGPASREVLRQTARYVPRNWVVAGHALECMLLTACAVGVR
jgi:hypothetical protein